MQVYVQYKTYKFSVKAFIHQPGMYDIEIKKGHTFRYDIWFGGEPPPLVTWEREGAQVQADQRITIELFSKKTVYCERNTVLTVRKVGTGELDWFYTFFAG